MPDLTRRFTIPNIYAVIKKSLNGEAMDYTTGSISRAVILLAIPMILELSLESVFALVDMFFVGRLGQNAIATVGLTESVLSIFYSMAMGLSMATTAIVARRTGEKNPEGAAHSAAQSFIIAIIISVILSTAGIIFAGDILRFMGANSDVVNDGAIFTRIMMGSCTAIMFLFLINGIFRGAGNAAMAMRSLWIASILNILLCPILIYFYGLKGAAMATVIGRSSGVVYQCYHLFKGKSVIQIARKHFAFDGAIVKSILKIAWPAAFQFIIGSGSWIILVRLVAETGGTAASAGYQIAFRNFIFFILPAWGLSNAAATLVGQNLGAKHPERAEQSVIVTAKYSVVFMSFVMLVFMIFPEPIVRFFSQDESVVINGIQSLRIMGSGFIFYGISMVFTQAFNGSGDTRTPTIINFICFWVIQIPLAYFLANGIGLKSSGAIAAVPIANTLIAIIAWYYFRKGKWKTVKI